MKYPLAFAVSILLTTIAPGPLWGQTQQAARADQLSAQVADLEAKGNVAAAIPLQKEVAAIYLNVLGQNHPDTATQINYLGHLLLQHGDYADGKQYVWHAYTVRRAVLGAEHALTGESLLNLAFASQNLSQYADAGKYYEQALAIFTKQLGEEHTYTLRTLNNIGNLHLEQENHAAARKYFTQALEIRQRVHGADHPDTAESLFNLGWLEHRQGNYSGARELYDRVLAIFMKHYGEQHPYTLQALHNSAALYDDVGDYAAAREGYAKVLRLRRQVLGDAHGETAETLVNLGVLFHQQGDYTTARAFYEQALPIIRQVRGEEHPYTLQVLNNLGVLVQDQGDYAAAREYHSQALTLRTKVLGEHADTAQSLVNMGGVYQAQKDYATARTYYDKALSMVRELLGEEHPSTLHILNVLAVLLHEQGDYDAAREHALQALTVREKVLGEEHPATAESLFNVGWLHHDAGDYAEARTYYERSLASFVAKVGEKHVKTMKVIGNFGLLEAADGNWPKAIEHTDRTRRLWRNSLSHLLVGMSPAEQLKFLTQDSHFHQALAIGLKRQDDPAAVDASAAWLVNGKGVSQEALAGRQLLMRDLRDPKSKQTAQQLLEVRRKLANLVVSVPDAGQEDARKEEIDRLTQEEQRLSRQLAQLVGQSVETEQWAELAAIRQALSPQAVLINIARFRPFDLESKRKGMDERWQATRYVAWIIPSAGQGQVRIVDLGVAEEIDQAVEAARTAIAAAAKPDGPLQQQGERAAEAALRKTLNQVSQRVWQPLAEHLPADSRQLVLSPDGALWLLPWSAIPIDEERYLVEDFSLRFVISGRELVASEESSASFQPLLFADPAFDLSPDRIRAAIQAIFRDFQFNVDAHRGLVSQTALGRVPQLPNTLLEAQAISPSVEQITGQEPIQYLGQYALESVVKRVKSPQVMVLSTHGFFLPDQQVNQIGDFSQASGTRSSALLTVDGKPIENPLLRCGLLLAGCNQPPRGGDDGILTGMEIVGLDLRGTDLVVLSACETGIGEVQAGEGVAGLRQAFQLAGAKGVVATLWQVPDRDSAIIMKSFFENLAEDQGQAEALRNSQLSRIESRRHRYGAAHPFFWAAWTLTE